MPDHVFFCHDEEFSWHHTGSIVDRLNDALQTHKDFVNVNHFTLGRITSNPLYSDILEWWQTFCQPYVSNMDKYPKDWTLGHKGCAQFLVTSSRIRMYPKDFYQGLYDWIISTDLPNSVSGRYLEWTWHVFWDDPPKRIL